MYQIKCDNYILYDPRDESLVVTNPKLTLETNTVGSGSFVIHSGHPYYDCLNKLKSVFAVLEDGEPIFRGRMTNDSKDWNGSKKIVLEGALAYLNDSIIEPFNFPEDFTEDDDYITAAASGNVVEFFLNWLITQHNSQVEDYQKFKLGNVTVTDTNNYISRSSEEYLSTWEVISSKLFKSSFGGKLCIRYEADGNYIDYLSEFAATNNQAIEFGENLLDLVTDSSAIDTYSAILPIGKDGLTIESIADGDLTSDLVKSGKIIYSRSAKTNYGYICKTVKWDDVTEAVNLKTKAMSLLSGTGVKLANTITVSAVDLHCTDSQIESLRINKKVIVNSAPHGYSGAFDLTKLDIDILSPQNTKLTLGETLLSLADINAKDKWENIEKVEKVTKDITEINDSLKETNSNVSALIQRVTTAESSITQQSNQIALKVSQSDMQTAINNIYEDISDVSDRTTNANTENINSLITRVSNNESAIFQTAQDILTTVSSTYQTKEDYNSDKKIIQSELTSIKQTAQNLTTTITYIQNDGVTKVQTETGFIFDKDGLKINKTDEEFNLFAGFDDKVGAGFYVKRNDEDILTATADGVNAANVTVRKYLIVGTNSRFEDYKSGRTGCFYIGS